MSPPEAIWVAEDCLLLRWAPESHPTYSLKPQLAFHALSRIRNPDIADSIADLVPGAFTLMVCFKPGLSTRQLEAIRGQIVSQASAPKAGPNPRSTELEIPMRYDGADLDFVADHLGLSVRSLVDWHSGTSFQVAFVGFAPGFPYLIPTEGTFEIPRLAEPRTRVPAGSVALAGGFCGIYPQTSSGGWRLIGSCDANLFVPARKRPALLAPGDRVRFVRA